MPSVGAAPDNAGDGGSRFPSSFVQCRGVLPYGSKRLLVGAAGAGEEAPGGVSRSAGIAPVTTTATGGNASDSNMDASRSFPHNIEFRTENILVSEIDERRGTTYDVILCLKLTK